jgi:hypothetical protein
MTATAPAQERHGRPSPRHGADRLLCGILAPLLEGPPAIPAWDERAWRAAFARPHSAPGLADALADRRLQPLMAWVASQVPPSRHLGAAAVCLAVLGAAVQRGERDPYRLGAEVEAAVRAARPLPDRAHAQARTSPSAHMDRHAAPDLRATAPTGSPFLPAATALLRRAGHELSRDARFAGRLAAALDVALAHWTTGSRPGGGLPDFAPEDRLRSDKRLGVRLGADRDLLYLVYGPQPGRGRPLQEARRRGLAYWVALTWRAGQLGERPPVPPPRVLAHWHQELCRLSEGQGAGAHGAAHSPDVPRAVG